MKWEAVAAALLVAFIAATATVAAEGPKLPDAPALPVVSQPEPEEAREAAKDEAVRTVDAAGDAAWAQGQEGTRAAGSVLSYLQSVLDRMRDLDLWGGSSGPDSRTTSTIAGPASPAASLMGYAAAAFLGFLALLVVAARRFGWIAALPLYSRIAKHQLLDNEVRATAYQYICENPGANVSEIARAAGLAWGTATHHLRKLRAERLVSIRLVNNQACYFENDGKYSQWEMDAMSALKHPTARAIASAVGATGAATQKEVADRLGVSRAVTSFHVVKLERAGVLLRERQGRAMRLSLVPRVADRLAAYRELLGEPAASSPPGAPAALVPAVPLPA